MFFNSKKNHLVGLDIGSRSIKVGELVENKKIRTQKKSGMNTVFTLKSFGMRDIPQDVIQEGIVKDSDTLAQSIRELITENGIKEKNVAISVSGYSVIVKRITLPVMGEDELRSRINYEAEQYIPFDINDVNLDFQIISESDNTPDQMNVILVAAKKDMINDYINLLEDVGLIPAVIDVDCFTLQNIFEISYDATDEIIGLIDIGANKTSINIIQNNYSLFMRDVSMGGDQLTQEISNRMNCSYSEAESLKISNSEDIFDLRSSTTMYWCSELKRAVDFFYSSYSDSPIKKIYLSGGSAFLEGFPEALSEETGIEIEIINPFQAFDIDPQAFTPDYLKRIAPQASICMGLAIRRVGDK